MSSPFRIIATSLACLCVLSFLHAAEDSRDPMPVPPYITVPADPSGWKISFHFKGADTATSETPPGALPPPVREITIYQAGGHRREIIQSNIKGTRQERYYINSQTVFATRSNGEVFREPAPPSTTGNLAEFSWIKPENYAGVQREKSRKYFVFTMPPPCASAEVGSSKPLVEAWIDVETRLPLKLEDRAYQRRYLFFKPTTADVEPPPAIRKYIESLGSP